MSKDIIAVAVDILNSSNTLGEKRELLRAARKRRRTSSKQLLDVIERLLSESVLPVRAGNELQLHGFSNISEDLYSKLGAVLNKSHCIPFNALCGEILWLHYHDVHYANISIYAYCHELEASDSNLRFEYTCVALGICRIYAKYQDPAFPYDSLFDKCTEYLCKHLDDDNFCALFILEGLTTCNLYLERIGQITLESIEHYEFMSPSSLPPRTGCGKGAYKNGERSGAAASLSIFFHLRLTVAARGSDAAGRDLWPALGGMMRGGWRPYRNGFTVWSGKCLEKLLKWIRN